ncbi:response regulator [Paenibacillus sp. CN-4]|uniref:response regulator n=1 Tax=Paenibacillus nanchangensis TaxID=3348343 RepID=UPI00397D552A
MYNVFLVDDEPFIIEGLYDIVAWDELGFGIAGHAENGRDALEKLKTIPADLLITDISMPSMNGLELIRRVREFQPDLKVIVLSGYDEFSYIKEGLNLGIENYLLKPINLEEFRQTLKNVADKLNATRADEEWSRYSTAVLKNNVMLRWVRSQIGWEELKERAGLLELDVNRACLQIALISTGGKPEVWEDRLSVLPTANNVLFRDADDNLVVVHLFDDPADGAAGMQRLIETVKSGDSSGRPRIALGTVEEAPAGAAVSYERAKRAQEYFTVYPERTVLRFEELKFGSGELKRYLPADWREYTRLVMAKNKEELAEKIGGQFSGENMEGLTPELLREIALEWTVYFRSLIKEIRPGGENDSVTESFGFVLSAESVRELAEAVFSAAVRAVDLLEREVKSPVVQQVLNHIHTSYNEDLSLKTLGAEYHIHPVYLGQLFHKEIGESFTEYMNRYRIEKAKEQLRSTHLKVHEIARNVGYWETGYFYKQFKKYVGISPTEFKGLV